jgi:hypothetical protein
MQSITALVRPLTMLSTMEVPKPIKNITTKNTAGLLCGAFVVWIQRIYDHGG